MNGAELETSTDDLLKAARVDGAGAASVSGASLDGLVWRRCAACGNAVWWGCRNVRDGLLEFASSADDPVDLSKRPRGQLPFEQQRPQLALDIRRIVEPRTHSDPELKTSRQYTNLSAAAVRAALPAKGDDASQLPSERTIRDILNRLK